MARIPFTKRKVIRAVEAARMAGLRVIGIKADGTVMVEDGDVPIAPVESDRHDVPVDNSWDDR